MRGGTARLPESEELTIPVGRRRGLLATIANLVVEPVAPRGAERDRPRPRLVRPAVAVIGLAPRCGATTVARALGAELALRDPGGAAVVSTAAVSGGGVPLGTAAAGRLVRALSRVLPVGMRAVGRTCLTTCGPGEGPALVDAARELAPVVLDVADQAEIALAASLVDAVVLLGVPATEPSLGIVVAESLSRVGPAPLVVLNRDDGLAERWHDRCAMRLPESRVGAQLAVAGREPRGDLGRAIVRLADLISAR